MGLASVPAPDVARLQAELNTAVRLHQQGRLEEAETAYTGILAKAPSQPDALNLLGVIHSERNRNDRAIELLSHATRVRPKDGNIWNNLGRACIRARRFEQAIDALERATSLAPHLAEVLGNLIQAHRAAGNVVEAEHYIARLRSQKDGSITADYEQARLLADLGKKSEATSLLVQVVTAHPQFGPAWQALARIKDMKTADPILDRLESAIAETSEPSPMMRFLCYSAGKFFDDLGEFDRAFAYFLRAKRQDVVTYDAGRTQKQFDQLKRVYDEAFIASHSGVGVPSERPIFIVGMPRSGTSLAEQILASHPEVFGGGELEYVAQITALVNEYAPTGKYPDAVKSLPDNTFAAFGFRYLRKIAAIDSSKPRFTDKMPHNFLSIGLLAALFEKLRIVHCVRHPFDTCLSCFMHDFAHSHDYNQTLEGLGSYYVLYRQLMEHWSSLLGDSIHTLQYESLLEDQTGESDKLLRFCGLDWDARVTDFAQTDRRVTTPSAWQVRKPLYRTSVQRWKNYEKHLLPALACVPHKYVP